MGLSVITRGLGSKLSLTEGGGSENCSSQPEFMALKQFQLSENLKDLTWALPRTSGPYLFISFLKTKNDQTKNWSKEKLH